MIPTFIDAQFLLAQIHPRDPWHQETLKAIEKMRRNMPLLTTHEVLTEFLAGMAKTGPYLRQKAVQRVEEILNDPYVTVVPQSQDLFQRGLDRYKQRPDKGYSLVDCISMVVMEDEGITDVLTNDHHFEQEGFTILIKRRN